MFGSKSAAPFKQTAWCAQRQGDVASDPGRTQVTWDPMEGLETLGGPLGNQSGRLYIYHLCSLFWDAEDETKHKRGASNCMVCAAPG